jgi:hypothetical protein
MTTVTDEYKALLKQTHAQANPKKPWGLSGGRNFGSRVVEFLEKRPEIKTVLDYGAGQRTLEKFVKANCSRYSELVWTNYDPGIDGIDTLPEEKFDLIVSSDVLEHVEPEQLPQVLKYLYEHNKYYQYHLIACDPCGSKLPDGRNAHLIVEHPDWWAHQFRDHGTIMYYANEMVRKRSTERHYACIQIDRAG